MKIVPETRWVYYAAGAIRFEERALAGGVL